MIDCENEVFTRIATVLRSSFTGINITSEYVNAPSSFPHVSVTESDNMTVQDQTTDEKEMAELMYEVNVYSNKKSGKKAECKNILKVIDNVLFSMNFRRLSKNPVPNLEDATIYRIVARYRVRTDGEYFYRS